MDANIRLTEIKVPRGTPIQAVSSCTAECTAKVLKAAGAQLMEPIMNLEIIVSEEQLGAVLSDLSGQRQSTIKEIQSRQDTRVIIASAPLKKLQVSPSKKITC
jgi:translation elongation factor EF-G